MNCNDIDFSVIIPQRDSVGTLRRLFESIPVSDRIEVIVVDNTPTPVTREEIGVNRDYVLLWSAPERHAGGARNVGIEYAHGRWLLFADADDFYTEGAFEVFYSMIETDADVVYYGMDGIYVDTGERSARGDRYTRVVKRFLAGEADEFSLRLGFDSPCPKMVKRSLVDRCSIRFDEVRASNDTCFALRVGYYASRIAAVDRVVYTATVSKGSLTRRGTLDVIESRFDVYLRYNKFLREHGFENRQRSVAGFIFESRRFGLRRVCKMILKAIGCGQPLFVNAGHWLTAYRHNKRMGKVESRYFVR